MRVSRAVSQGADPGRFVDADNRSMIASPASALQIHAGPRAISRLRQTPLLPEDVAAVPAAAGGAKALVLNPLDRHLFAHFLGPGATLRREVHLIGASIGAWRMAIACRPDPDAGFAGLADDYIGQRYQHRPGRAPPARHVSEVFGARLAERFGGVEAEVLSHPQFRLHVVVARGRHLLRRDGRVGSGLTTPLGYLGAFAANALHRRALGVWLERVLLSDPRTPLPLALDDYPTRRVALGAANLQPALLASCSIPFWLESVRQIPGVPPGACWDGGLTDYHFHWPWASLGDGLVLYPHFQPQVVPGWLDKPFKRRHRATPALDNLVVLSPRPDWIARLPNGKLPDRSDFKAYGDDHARRQADWRRAVGESQRLADEFAAWTEGRLRVPVQPLP